MPVVSIDSFVSPGVYVSEVSNPRAIQLITPSVAYMLGTSTGEVGLNVPVLVQSLAEFSTKFPASPSLVYVEAYFLQTKRPFYFVNILNVGVIDPTISEITTALNSLTEALETGVIFAPELFADVDRTDGAAIANAISSKATQLQWLTVIDTPYIARATVGVDDIASGSVRAFATAIGASNKPSVNLIFPWVVNTNNVEMAASAHIVGMYIYVWTRDGFSTPPAGTNYPLTGIANTVTPINKAVQDTLNPKNINCVRFFRNAGWCLYGSRMLDGTFVNSRVVLNVISASMADVVQRLVFANLDSQGLLFLRAKELAETVLYRIWLAGGLTGNSAQTAYSVICDNTNNTSSTLQAGKLIIDIYLTPSSTVEVVVVVPHTVTIGGLEAALENLLRG